MVGIIKKKNIIPSKIISKIRGRYVGKSSHDLQINQQKKTNPDDATNSEL